MASMIEEADDVSQQLLDIILEHVVMPKQQEEPEAYRSHCSYAKHCILHDTLQHITCLDIQSHQDAIPGPCSNLYSVQCIE